jgi:hypothetical protein
MNYLILYFFSFSLFAAPYSIQEAWTDLSDPALMSRTFESRLGLLPTEGKVNEPKKFWSGDYWAMVKGNINYRWHAERNFSLNSPDKATALTLTQDQIAQLSPAEKFDLLNGRYYYPLKVEVEKLTDYDAKKWEGICHGWAPATMNHNEPTPKTLLNPDGIKIPFGSADIKAIVSYFYAYAYQVDTTHQMGRRCDEYDSDDCKQDLNAGAFHIILTNRIGLENKGFVADMNRLKQVWNHPVLGFTTRVKSEGGPKRNSAPGTTRTVKFSTTIEYGDESINSWDPLIGTRYQKTKKQEMNYIVDINAEGMIIGGEWTSMIRPDFLWFMERPQKFSGNFLKLSELLND